MKKKNIVALIVIIVSAITLIIEITNKSESDILIDKFNDVDLNGFTPCYKTTHLKIENNNLTVAVIEDVDGRYYLFSLTVLKKGEGYSYFCSPLIGDEKDLFYLSASTNEKERRYFGLYPEHVEVTYNGKLDFLEYKTITLEINGVNYDYTIWNMELSKNQKFDHTLFSLE
ncbi:hypothetical protein M2475_002254 [Breznakia sp. PF5-3]|uniref:hypothetical protein n=1 Tax=unclassified Breznakia TaxID=2623764 RepID=UPI002407276B|nr:MULTISPECIES: hypothetical protein [unclassified Breznakia]MDF9825877.1 hypothetical protein [Breznakia sp. PM6-1]MDF9836669.1 hypothetical protein [Breznakia sp. PF5-3]MDF9838943.1 hypothetical protein [Breznakia sp. PFB2-8]MDF9860969.1 hypothetical protein [Breznakia sp. PH5-24]